MHIPIKIGTAFQGFAWTVGFCPECQDVGVIRLEKVLEVTSLGWVTMNSIEVGVATRCDFCERHIPSIEAKVQIPLDEWSYDDGLATLFGKLALPLEIQPPHGFSDARLHSLLSATRESGSIFRQPNGFVGMIAGVVVGIALGFLVGVLLFQCGILHGPRFNAVGVPFGCAFVGSILGFLGGGLLEASLRGKTSAYERLSRTVVRYRIDVSRLTELAEEHRPIVRRAVRAVRDFSGLPASSTK